MSDFDDSELTELLFVDPSRVDGVMTPATGSGFIVLKSVSRVPAKPRTPKRAGRLVRDKDGVVTVPGPDGLARERAKAAERARNARKAAEASSKRAAKAARRMAGSPEIPVTNVRDESASIMSAVTGEHTNRLCNARTVNGTPCRRPAAAGKRCTFHM